MNSDEIRLRRLRMRSWRRGMKEMDLILGPWADERLARLPPETLDLYEDLLEENDQDLYPWVTARIGGNGARGPQKYTELMDDIAQAARVRFTTGT